MRVQPATSDRRPESLRPDLESIEIVGHLDSKQGWADRKAIVDPLPRFETLRHVLAEQERSSMSLAVVDPGHVLDLAITQRPAAEMKELEERARRQAMQGSLFDVGDPQTPLEPMSVDFHYVVQYPDEDEPTKLKIIDWEINEAWRRWRHQYSDPAAAIKQRWLDEIAGGSKDLAFFVGNMHRFPTQFLVLSTFWPPKLPI